MSSPLHLAVIVSGRGSNLQAILDRCRSGEIAAKVSLVMSNRPGCQGLLRARQADLETFAITRRQAGGRPAQMRQFANRAAAAGAQLIVLAGFDRIVGGALLARFEGRIINIHPSLLPAFAGGMAPAPQAAAIAAGVRFSGCTVHLVTDQLDGGPIIDQAVVPVHRDDCPQSLAQRILREEHRLLPSVIDRLARGRLHVDGQWAWIEESK